MSQETRTIRSIRNICTGIVSRIILLLLPFINRTIIIWFLGTEYLGLSSLFTSILSVLSLSELGIGFAVSYNMYGLIARKNHEGICSLLNFYRKFYIFVGTIILIFGISVTPFLHRFIKGNPPSDVYIYLLYIIYLVQTVSSFLVLGYKSILLSAHQRADIVNGIQTISLIGQQLTQVFVLIIARNFYIFALMYPIWTILNNIIISITTRKKYPLYVPKGKINREEGEKLKKQVSGLLADRVSVAIRNSTDNVIISSFFGLSVLAKYSNYYYIMYTGVYGTLLYLMQSIQASIGDSIVRETIEKNHGDFLKINFLFSWINVISTTCLFGLFQPFISLWAGKDNLLPNQVMFMFCIYCYCFNITTPINPYMDGNGLWDKVKEAVLFFAGFNVVMDIILGRSLGISGIILATIVSLVIPYVFFRVYFLYKYYFRSCKISLYYGQQALSLVAVLVSCLVVHIVLKQDIFVSNVIIMLLTKALLCVLISSVIFVIIFCRRREFKESLMFIYTHFYKKNLF